MRTQRQVVDYSLQKRAVLRELLAGRIGTATSALAGARATSAGSAAGRPSVCCPGAAGRPVAATGRTPPRPPPRRRDRCPGGRVPP
ncbi:hypothetical protein COO58_07285 [Micromonospora sp. WMMA1996]|uniref:DUF5318 family protein n=1 Tax=Micromonospora sp. WMMA1996 TaxID=2039878 RepID=UPI000BF2D852|nr:DUF5318 family protein [Micromonospora sp. WMMA1996]PGH44255.1 hypothetical protein COO58_07285 [Micromonospora sp. WMMA1996]